MRLSQIHEEVGKYDGGLPILSNEELAEKHGVDIKEIKKEIKLGIKVEKEHDNDIEDAENIARQHVYEDPRYYRKLKNMHKEE